MSQGRLTALVVTYLVLIGAMWSWILVAGLEPRLGLDLQGGISANLIPAEGQGEIDEEILDQTVGIIRERVDALGVAEPDIARQGRTIQVQLPGIEDQEQARDTIGRTAQLQFRQVVEVLPPAGALPVPSATVIPSELPPIAAPSEGAEEADATEAPDGAATDGASDPAAAPTEAATGSAGKRVTEVAQATGSEATGSEASESEATGSEASESEATEGAAPTEGASATPSATPTAASTPTAAPAEDDGSSCEERSQVTIPDPEAEVILCLRGYDENGEELPREQWSRLRMGPVEVSGADLADARAELLPGALAEVWQTTLEFDSEGADAFQEVTGRLACAQGPARQLAIVLDTIVEQAPPVAQDVLCGEGIAGGTAVVQANSEADARSLAVVLRAGALPIQLDFGTFQTISPTLGRDSLDASILAGIVGLVLVTLYLTFLYRGMGLAAVAEIVVGIITVVGLMIVLGETVGFTLTLAGIAGIIISIGIAGDSSIIYRERYRDELRAGRTIRTAADYAFSNSFRTNLTGAIVSLLAAIVLYLLAVGPVRGFAFTLGVSTLVDLVLFSTFTRGLFGLIARNPRLAGSPFIGLTAGVTSEQLARALSGGGGRGGRPRKGQRSAGSASSTQRTTRSAKEDRK